LSLAGAVVDVAGAAGSVARRTFIAAFRADVAAALSAEIRPGPPGVFKRPWRFSKSTVFL
jgi:hypothetical protein